MSKTYEILDTCIWISLVQEEGLEKGLVALKGAVEEGSIYLAVPEVVQMELQRSEVEEETRVRIKKRLQNQIRELRRAANTLTPEVANTMAQTLDQFVKALEKWSSGIPERLNIVRELLEHPSTEIIPLNDAARCAAANRGLMKKAPLHRNKNSVADALIIESARAWVKERSGDSARFHTLNYEDFSRKDHRQKHHEDLDDLFEGNCSYSYGMEEFIGLVDRERELLDEARRIDFGGPGYCNCCNNPTMIEGASCAKCGTYIYDLPDNEYYSVEDGEDGQLIFDSISSGGDEVEVRVKCPNCQNDTFDDIEYASLCSYHEYNWDRD